MLVPICPNQYFQVTHPITSRVQPSVPRVPGEDDTTTVRFGFVAVGRFPMARRQEDTRREAKCATSAMDRIVRDGKILGKYMEKCG